MSESLAPWIASPFGRALWPYALVGVGFSLALHFLLEPFAPSLRSTWNHIYPLQAIIAAGGLVILLRCQAAQETFREGRSHLQTLSSKLTDLAVLAISLDEKNLLDSEYLVHRIDASEENKHRRFVAVLVHLISLMHAIAVGTLSGDLSMEHIEVHEIMEETREPLTARAINTPHSVRTSHSHRSSLQRRPSNHSGDHHLRSTESTLGHSAMRSGTPSAPPFVTRVSNSNLNSSLTLNSPGAPRPSTGDSALDPLLPEPSRRSPLHSGSSTNEAGPSSQDQDAGASVSVQLAPGTLAPVTPGSLGSRRGSESPRGAAAAARLPRMHLAPLRMLPETVAALSHHAQHTARSMMGNSSRHFSRMRSRVATSIFADDTGVLRSRQNSVWPLDPRSLPVIMGMGGSEARALGMHLPLDSSDEGWSDGDGPDRASAAASRRLRGSVQLGAYLPPALERMHTLHAWLVKHIMQRTVDGGLGVVTDAPTRARMHDILSSAMHAFEQAKKLTETDPPVASGNLVSMALWTVTLLSPMATWLCISNALFSTLLSCTFTIMLVALSELSSDLEAPFAVHVGNSVSTGGALPPSALQFKLNERLLAVSTTYRPHGNADMITHTEAAATAAVDVNSSRAAFSHDLGVSTGPTMHGMHACRTPVDTEYSTTTTRAHLRHSSPGDANTTGNSARHGHANGHANGRTSTVPNGNNTPTGSTLRSPLYSATVSSEVSHPRQNPGRHHHRSPTFARSPPHFGTSSARHRRSASDSPRSSRIGTLTGAQTQPQTSSRRQHTDTHTPERHALLLASGSHSQANASLQGTLDSEAQGSIEVNFSVPAIVSPSADSPQSSPGMPSMYGTHEFNTSASAHALSATTVEQSMTMPALESSQPVPMHVNYRHASLAGSTSQGPTEAEAGRHSLSTSLSSELWVLGKLGGESPDNSRTGSMGRESYVLSQEGSMSNTALGRSPGNLLEASRSFPSRHTRVNSLESSDRGLGPGLDNSVNLDWVGVPVACPPQTSGYVHHVSSRSIVRNNEFEEVLSSSRALVHGQAGNIGRGGDAHARARPPNHGQDLSSASTLAETEIAALTKLHPAVSTSRQVVGSKRRSSNTSGMHGTHASAQSSRNSAGAGAASRSGDARQEVAAAHGKEIHGESGGNHENAAPPQESVGTKSAVRTWPNGALESSVESVGVFHPREAAPSVGRDGAPGVPRPRTPTSLVMWNSPADAA